MQEPVAPTESPASLPSDSVAESNLQTASDSATLGNVASYTVSENSLQTASNLPTEASETTTPSKALKSESKPKIIVVTKEIVVNDTVFARDTVIVKDTVYLMQKP